MQIDIDIESVRRFELCRALLIYGNGKEGIATQHAILNHAGSSEAPPQLGPGVCMTRDALTELLRDLTRSNGRVILPERVLCADAAMMAWWSPMKRAPIYFKTAEAAFNALLSGRDVLHPPLLFLAKAGRLWVWGLPENVRPAEETPLLRAPYCNLYDTGSMCIGNAFVPQSVNVAEVDVWERAFFETNFTHSNYATGPLCRHVGKHNGLWEELMGRGELEGFPFEHLVAAGLTVGEAVNEVTPKQGGADGDAQD